MHKIYAACRYIAGEAKNLDYGHVIQTIKIIIFIIILPFLLRYPFTRLRNTAQNRRHSCLPPPKIKSIDPFLGLDLARKLHRAVAEHRFLPFLLDVFRSSQIWTQEVNLLGQTKVWTADPEVIRTILATRAKDWHAGATRKALIESVVGINIFTREGPDWRHTRTVMRPAFTRRQFGGVAEQLGKHVDRMMGRLPVDGDGETVVDLKPLFHYLSKDLSTEFLFGLSSDTLTMSSDAEGVKFSEELLPIQANIVRGKWMGKLGEYIFPNKNLRQALGVMNRRLDDYVKRTMELEPPSECDQTERTDAHGATDQKRYSVVHELLKSWPSDLQRIRSEVTILTVAGRDTTAAALTNTFFYLARSPEVWKKIREECLAAGTKNPTPDDLKALKYTHDCVREGLRMVNPTVDITRTAAVDTTLPSGGGSDGKSPMFVRKGTHFNLWIYVMQHRKDIWGDDADEYRPERWEATHDGDYNDHASEDKEKSGKGSSFAHAYSPFGGGPRICLGQQLAMTEMLYTIFRLAKKFSKIQSADSETWTEKLGITTSSLNGTKVRLIP